MGILALARRHPLVSFFGLTFLFSWLWWGGLFLMTTGSAAVALASPAVLLYAVWGPPLVGPALAGLLMSFILEAGSGVRSLLGGFSRWRVGIGWYVVALLLTAFVWGVVLMLLTATDSPSFRPALASTIVGVLLAPIGGGVSSLLEEIGWTGFALPRLLAKRGAAVAGILLGLVWGVWHIVINVWAYDVRVDSQALATYAFGVGTAFLPLIAYRVLMVWVYVNTRHSLLLGWLMHWSYIVALSVIAPAVSGWDVVLANGVFTAAVWLTTLAVVALYGARTLHRESASNVVSAVAASRPASS